MTEDEMVGWHHRLNGHEFEQALGDGEGQGNLACCSPWDFLCKNTGVGCHFLLQEIFPRKLSAQQLIVSNCGAVEDS